MFHTEQAYNILVNLKSTFHNGVAEKRHTTELEESRKDNPDCTEIALLKRQLAQKTEQLVCSTCDLSVLKLYYALVQFSVIT